MQLASLVSLLPTNARTAFHHAALQQTCVFHVSLSSSVRLQNSHVAVQFIRPPLYTASTYAIIVHSCNFGHPIPAMHQAVKAN